jgi:hypothetical protein
MAVEIEDHGVSLKITTDAAPRYIIKSQIREISVIRDTIIKIDTGEGALYNVYVDQSVVDLPASKDVNDLRDQIELMMESGMAGAATAKKQDDQTTLITGLQASMKDVQDKLGSINDKKFYDPILVDEVNPNVVYRGFAAQGSKTSDAVWAVQKVTNVKGVLSYLWAAGNKSFASIWDNRAKLVYS